MRWAVTVYASDYEASKAFYRDTLGMDVDETGPDSLVARATGSRSGSTAARRSASAGALDAGGGRLPDARDRRLHDLARRAARLRGATFLGEIAGRRRREAVRWARGPRRPDLIEIAEPDALEPDRERAAALDDGACTVHPARFGELVEIVREGGLHTVCEEARCPNIGECWGRGTATFQIMGETCTRACRYCAVRSRKVGEALDPLEPGKVAAAAEEMGLRHVVVTSVDRDDLRDRGAGHWAPPSARCAAAAPTRRSRCWCPTSWARRRRRWSRCWRRGPTSSTTTSRPAAASSRRCASAATTTARCGCWRGPRRSGRSAGRSAGRC